MALDFLFRWFSEMSSEKREKISILNEIKLFEFCSKEDLQSIAEQCEYVPFERDEHIIDRGEPGDGMYMIEEGSVTVHLEEDSEPVSELSDGNYFGEMSLLDNEPRSAYVIGQESGRLLFFSKDGFQSMLPKSTKTVGKIMYVFARTLSRRLRETNNKLRELEARVEQDE